MFDLFILAGMSAFELHNPVKTFEKKLLAPDKFFENRKIERGICN